MKRTTKIQAALVFMLDVALEATEHSPTGLNDVAQRNGYSMKYLWQIANPLKRAGLLRAQAGAGGGYRLARSPAQISLLEILKAVDGDAMRSWDVEEQTRCTALSRVRHLADLAWSEAASNWLQILESRRLSELVSQAQATRVAWGYCI